jgi:hypothetical protein
VLGCVEKDVNSQLTKVLSIGGSASKPTLAIEFRNSFTVAQRFYLENVRFALSKGEFFVDNVANKLFYWPAEPGTPTGVVAPIMDRIVEVEHSRGHVLTNVTFTDTTYFADGFWDGPAQQPSDAAVRVNYAQDVTISGCHFLGGLGGYGVAIGNASVDVTVEGSLFDSVGQGGVIAFGYDTSPVPAHPGQASGNNTQPRRLTITHNVMSNLGLTLIHVAGVAFRAASDSLVAHNRVHKTPRYGIQADSFYVTAPPAGSGAPGSGLISRGNIFEFNVISETNRYTTDTGAIEMLGSGDPNSVAWWNNNTIRYNNISDTVGSSSSDGKNVCVHGVPSAGCRKLVWGIYLVRRDLALELSHLLVGAAF